MAAALVVVLLAYVARLHVVLRRSRYDELTGVLTRGSWNRAARRALRHAEVVVVLDLDGFKAINDRYGHCAGDRLLRVVGHRLQTYAGQEGSGVGGRPRCVVGRLGGDEFAAVVPEVVRPEALREMLAEPIDMQGRTVSIGVSIGIAPVVPGLPLETLISCADEAMYKRKRDRKAARASTAG